MCNILYSIQKKFYRTLSYLYLLHSEKLMQEFKKKIKFLPSLELFLRRDALLEESIQK